MKIITFGKDRRTEYAKCYLENSLELPPLEEKSASDGTERSIYILPTPSSRDRAHITGTDLSIAELLNSSQAGDIILGYGLECFSGLTPAAVRLIDTASDEEYILENAALTADAAISHLLYEHEMAPRDMSIGIIGYGRIGKMLARELMALGAGIALYTSGSHSLTASELSQYHRLRVISYSEMPLGLDKIDVLINTAPCRILKSDYSKLLSCCTVLELASGENIPKELQYTRLASLPGIKFPKSAGIAMAKSLLRQINS